MPRPQSTTVRHRRQAPYPGATQQPIEQGFGLVILMLGQQQHLTRHHQFAKRCVSGLASGALQAGTRRDLHVLHIQGNAQLVTQPLTVRRPAFGNGLQAMMDVNGADWRQLMALGRPGKQVQQHTGVEPAGIGYPPERCTTPRRKARQHGGFERHGDFSEAAPQA